MFSALVWYYLYKKRGVEYYQCRAARGTVLEYNIVIPLWGGLKESEITPIEHEPDNAGV